MSIFTIEFWRAAGERAFKSVAQGFLVAGIGAAGFNVLAPGTDWRGIVGIALGMGVASLLTSVASDALTSGAGPSLTDAEVLADAKSAPINVQQTFVQPQNYSAFIDEMRERNGDHIK
jgi:hypothetical protein